MKQILTLLLASSIVSLAQAQEELPYMTKSLKDAAIEKVTAETSGGNISITGNATDLKIEVYVRPNNGRKNDLTKEEIEKKLNEDYEFTVSTANHVLTAIAKPKTKSGRWDWKKALSVSFKIYVPRNVATNLTTSGGNVSLAHLSGVQDFRTSGGNLHLEDLTGKIKGATSGGNIHLKDSKDDITLTTSGGNVEARNCDGKLHLTTSGGNVTLEDLSGNIDATTSGGTVRGNAIKGDLSAVTSGGNVMLSDLSASVNASTSGGNMNVTIKELGSFVKLSNSGGNINVELPGNKGLDLRITGDKVKASALNNFSGTVDEDSIDGKLNGGGIPVTVKGSSGRVTLTIK
ncbi:hypothetical protein [Paraflavitalea sp. CAU 1676]|uniref:DUF4097 family beta strand repeat-containing protein n=1 Tax=Paraflavitalea sp. CAU 1676 TaxID=3032598 RepID=UPI0023DB6B40|nr:hypothetical protein [Paraflavitalea sp. CAU 1676]MDF2192015.1 hypothetical protein [Paraflavitalea sp. CAU 1676]